MAWIPKEKEIAALLAADGRRRYEYFIHRVCDTRQVWGLHADGWAILDDGEHKLIPVWPHAIFATRFAPPAWDGYAPQAIDLDTFLKEWPLALESQGTRPAIFPVPSGSSVLVSWGDLVTNLRDELATYHGEEE